MASRTLFRAGFLALFLSQLNLLPCLGQSKPCAESASDVEETLESSSAIIDNVEVHGDNPFSESQWSIAISQVKKVPFGGAESTQDPRTLEYVAIPIRALLQDNGYFKAVVIPTIFLTRAEPDAVHYVLSVSIQAGEQFHLGQMRFRSTDPYHPELAFNQNELRQQFELQNGDLFDVSKIRHGLDSLEKLYLSKGFLDMVPSPEADIYNSGSHRNVAENGNDPRFSDGSSIDLTIAIDQGKPYRISKIETLGLPLAVTEKISLPQAEGDLFLPNVWTEFWNKAQAQLPHRGNSYDAALQMTRDAAHHTVALALGYRPCPTTPALPVIRSGSALP